MRALWILLAATLITSGCELTEECDPNTDPDCTTASPNPSESGTPTPTPTLPYLYVWVEDAGLDPSEAVMTGGVDIEGVSVTPQGGSETFADQIHECVFGPDDNSDATNCAQALGDPGAACDMETPDFVSLGGAGGYLIVSFTGIEIQAGDTITVTECGAARNAIGVDERYDVLVSTDSSISGSAVECVAGGAGVTSCTVPTLPDVPAS